MVLVVGVIPDLDSIDNCWIIHFLCGFGEYEMNPYQKNEPFYRNVTDREMGYAPKGYEWCRRCGDVEAKEPEELCPSCRQAEIEHQRELDADR